MIGFNAWENELFDKYNGEGHMTEEEYWADVYDEDYPPEKEDQ